MRILPYENVNEVAEAVEKELRSRATRKVLRVFLPTGKTPLPLYKIMREDPEFWKSHLEGIQIDDFIDRSRPFFSQLDAELVRPIGIKLSAWDPKFSSNDIIEYTKRIIAQPIDVAILGLGPNGHVGFHEPGVSKSFEGGKLEVTEETRVKSKGPTRNVLSFGVGAFLKADAIFLIVTGEEKRLIFEKFMETEPTSGLPATLLKTHKNLIVFTDLD